ncbi:MAG TPA: M23 family metallopeptidase [Candidatus Thermoplasmatota archaeon]|nr:M23 family metallopeptidase [Candidatus Thermoplasmatota archaeon]
MKLKQYPLPKKYRFRNDQSLGQFLENRGDRIHCGIDIYAPEKTPVFAVDDGVIKSTSEFSSPYQISYWNTTYEIILEAKSSYFFRFAELSEVFVKKDDKVSAGDQIGLVGQVLNPKKINEHHPGYIQKLADKNKLSMLHFEIYNRYPEKSKYYLGGNWFAKKKPPGLCNPTEFLI